MTNPRTVLGKKLDGHFGLRCSLTGVNALTGDSSLGGFSFDDEWTDIVRIALVGTANVPGGSFSAADPAPTTTVSHGLGFVPFIEARLVSGSTINDDFMSVSTFSTQNRLSGVPVDIATSQMQFIGQQSGPLASGNVPYVAYSVVYVVYALAVPNPS